MKARDRVKGFVGNLAPYRLARKAWGRTIRAIKGIPSLESVVVSLNPKRPPEGNVLCSFLVEPFLLKPGEPFPSRHTALWECFQVVNTFLDFGYCVDVINYNNQTFTPQKNYSFFVDTRYNFERIAPMLNGDCVKILHIETAHILFHNAAESNRLLALQRRRGVVLMPRRWEKPTRAIEHADCAVILGNHFTIETYRYANKPLYRLPISTTDLYPWPEEKDFEACRKHFLWFGSGGLVHKGLDLVLEAFSQMPEYHLTVCGPVEREKDFEKAFSKELYHTSNIQTVGWVDVSSPKFVEIANSCIGLVYPSCSEGQCGGVVTCLHASLIPVVSYESGVDVDDFGVILKESSIEEIKSSVRMVSSLPLRELKEKARKAWEFARGHHTRDKFAEQYHKVIAEIVANYRFGARGRTVRSKDTKEAPRHGNDKSPSILQ
jgi:glycosyltransferase involved in cell wall biosynthesis